MSEKARTVFNIEEQKAKDVLAAIKVVQPVLSIIRYWGVKEKEYEKVSENNAELAKQMESIAHVCGLTCEGLALKEELSQLLKDKSSKHKEFSQREKELKCICTDLEEEVILYQKYAKMFSWIDKDIIEKVLNLNNFDNKEEFLSMMFLFLNAGISYYNLKPLNFFIGKEGYYTNVLLSSGGWNNMLKYLKSNKL